MTDKNALAGLLDRAGRVIETNGYCRTYLYNTRQAAAGLDPAHCPVDIIGAINIALHGTPTFGTSTQGWAAEKALAERTSAPSVAAWSCRPGNGKAEALDLLDDTADHLRKAVAS